MKLSKEQFKILWESDDEGGGITFNDIADCAVNWRICKNPKTMMMSEVRYLVLRAAKTRDSEEFAV